MFALSHHSVLKVVALLSAIVVLGLGAIRPAVLAKTHLSPKAPTARFHESRLRNLTFEVSDSDTVDQEIQHVARRVALVVVTPEVEQSSWTRPIISPALEVLSKVRCAPHRKISSSSNSDPDLLA